MTKFKQKRWKRSGKKIKHHIVNRCNGGNKSTKNLLFFDSEREKAWHFLFKNLSFEEVAEHLLRTSRAKNAQH
jgi:hypothetical protein